MEGVQGRPPTERDSRKRFHYSCHRVKSLHLPSFVNEPVELASWSVLTAQWCKRCDLYSRQEIELGIGTPSRQGSASADVGLSPTVSPDDPSCLGDECADLGGTLCCCRRFDANCPQPPQSGCCWLIPQAGGADGLGDGALDAVAGRVGFPPLGGSLCPAGLLDGFVSGAGPEGQER